LLLQIAIFSDGFRRFHYHFSSLLSSLFAIDFLLIFPLDILRARIAAR